MREECRSSDGQPDSGLPQGERGIVTLAKMAMGGDAIGRVQNFVVFVPYGIPQDEIEFQILSRRKNFAKAAITTILKASPHRVKPTCKEFFRCGGCHFQHIQYASQLSFKKEIITDALFRIGQLSGLNIRDVAGQVDPWFYRNKVQAVAGYDNSRTPVLGLYARHTHDLVPIEGCLIQSPLNNRIVNASREMMQSLSWEMYDEKTHTGWLRHLISRVSGKYDEAIVILVSRIPDLPDLHIFIDHLREKVPEVRGVLLIENAGRTNVITGGNASSCRLLWGTDHLREEIGGLEFRISPLSFFQVNSDAAKTMAERVLHYARLKEIRTVLDAYCGVGVFALLLAGEARKVYGIEENPSAVSDALENAHRNRIENVEFIEGRAEHILADPGGKKLFPDLVVLDPPRSGVMPEVLNSIAAMKVSRIIYVSCNPATLARDLRALKELGYAVGEIQPVDMFPQTCQVEVVAYLERG